MVGERPRPQEPPTLRHECTVGRLERSKHYSTFVTAVITSKVNFYLANLFFRIIPCLSCICLSLRSREPKKMYTRAIEWIDIAPGSGRGLFSYREDIVRTIECESKRNQRNGRVTQHQESILTSVCTNERVQRTLFEPLATHCPKDRGKNSFYANEYSGRSLGASLFSVRL